MNSKLYLFAVVALLFACSEDGKVFHDYKEIENDKWFASQKISYPVEIENSRSKYTINYLVRYTKDYPYYNFYVKRFLLDSTGKQLSSTLQGMYIFDEKTGEPKGSGWGNKYDYTILSDSNFKFPYKGRYTIELQQYMRQDTIQGISDFGLSILQHE